VCARRPAARAGGAIDSGAVLSIKLGTEDDE
jgi:hypothetical protein